MKKHLKKITLIIILFQIFITNTFAQELNCQVQVYSNQIEGSDKRIYETLQKALYEFMNNRKWSNFSLKQEEKVECSIMINITERVSTEDFKATIQVQSRRPIYKSSYNSVMLNHMDKDFAFKYIEFQPLDFIENTFTSNITSVMAYYAYIILGFDFDSFSLYGGTPYFEKAQTIVSNAQNAPESGWKSFESQKNRYWLVENLLNKIYSPVRDCIYNYHRKGLDLMSDNAESARNVITSSLEMIQKSYREKPGNYLTQIFFDAKADEIANIYSQASPMDKTKATAILREVDPTNAAKYRKITEAK